MKIKNLLFTSGVVGLGCASHKLSIDLSKHIISAGWNIQDVILIETAVVSLFTTLLTVTDLGYNHSEKNYGYMQNDFMRISELGSKRCR